MENKIDTLPIICEDWINVNTIDFNCNIPKEIQCINCDTRDFAINWNIEAPKIYKKANCGFESESNKGLSKLYSLINKSNRSKYTINKNDIIKWLDELCKISGGYDKEWRYLNAKLKNCNNWELKYIRFVKNNNYPDEFIVCNSHFCPIEYKEIVKNLDKEFYAQ